MKRTLFLLPAAENLRRDCSCFGQDVNFLKAEKMIQVFSLER